MPIKPVYFRFPLRNMNNMVIVFKKHPTKEDWAFVRKWFGLWGENLLESIEKVGKTGEQEIE